MADSGDDFSSKIRGADSQFINQLFSFGSKDEQFNNYKHYYVIDFDNNKALTVIYMVQYL